MKIGGAGIRLVGSDGEMIQLNSSTVFK